MKIDEIIKNYIDYAFSGFILQDNKITLNNRYYIYYMILGYLDSMLDSKYINIEIYDYITDKLEDYISYSRKLHY